GLRRRRDRDRECVGPAPRGRRGVLRRLVHDGAWPRRARLRRAAAAAASGRRAAQEACPRVRRFRDRVGGALARAPTKRRGRAHCDRRLRAEASTYCRGRRDALRALRGRGYGAIGGRAIGRGQRSSRRRARQRRLSPARDPAVGCGRRGRGARRAGSEMTVALKINGAAKAVEAGLSDTLLTVLRDQCLLTAAKRGCNQGVCGACTVLVDGRPQRACLTLAANCEGATITTLEGLKRDPTMMRLQKTFASLGAVQCGFCTPGILISAHWL